MVRGPKKHMKRMFAPSHWMLDKLSGVYAPKPSPGPHKSRECLPLAIILRNRLKYALNMTEVVKILNQKDGNVKVDGKVRKDAKFPAGFMDVITIEKTGDLFRLLYDVKGRFTLTKIDATEAAFKLCRIKKRLIGTNQVPYVVTHDGRTIRFPHPEIHANDTVKVNLKTGEIEEWVKFDVGNLSMVTAGNNIGRVGVITHKEKHIGGFDIYHLKDARGHSFATRINNVFIIGQGKKPMITLPKQKGIKLTILEEQTQKFHEAWQTAKKI